jgi:hypothetical protein
LPGYPVSHIGFSTLVASYFFTVPNISFNLQQAVLMTPWGRALVYKAQRERRAVYAWTVNDESRMRWFIRHGLDGVITDDPKLFLEVRNSWHEGTRDGLSIMTRLDLVRVNFFSLLFTLMYWCMYGIGDARVKKR